MNRGTVGKLQVKTTSHWNKIDSQYWKKCGVEGRDMYEVNDAMVRFQHTLLAAGKCKGGNLILAGDRQLYRWGFYKRDRCTLKEYKRTPYHEDLLENWGKYSLFYWQCVFAFFSYIHS